jgi:hypothetical protein
MRKIWIPIVAIGLTLASFKGCDVVESANTILGGSTTGQKPGLSNDDVIKGLKEALSVGTNNSSALTSKTDGFFKNDRIFLPFPEDAIKVKEKAIQLGMQDKVDKFVMTLNRAAEESTKEAAPIFLKAITDMSIGDGFTILKGADNAATQYLTDKTSGPLYDAFKPKVQAAISKVELTKYWEPLATAYNKAVKLTGGDPVTTDLEDYVTKRAIKGLFTLIADEELKIRKDPIARVSDILKSVFSTLDK